MVGVVDFTEEEAVEGMAAVAAVNGVTYFRRDFFKSFNDFALSLVPCAAAMPDHSIKRSVTASYPGPLQQRCSTRVTPVCPNVKVR